MQTETTATQQHASRIAPRAMTEADASSYTGMSREFLRQSRMHGRRVRRTPGPAFVKIGKSVRYMRDDLDAWLMANRRHIA